MLAKVVLVVEAAESASMVVVVVIDVGAYEFFVVSFALSVF